MTDKMKLGLSIGSLIQFILYTLQSQHIELSHENRLTSLMSGVDGISFKLKDFETSFDLVSNSLKFIFSKFYF